MPIFQIFVHSSTSLLYFIIIEYLFKYNSHKLHNVIKLIKVKKEVSKKSTPFYIFTSLFYTKFVVGSVVKKRQNKIFFETVVGAFLFLR